jgi:hypothetical protein
MSTRHHRRACAAPDPYGLSEFQLRTLNCVRAEALGDLAIGIDASLHYDSMEAAFSASLAST